MYQCQRCMAVAVHCQCDEDERNIEWVDEPAARNDSVPRRNLDKYDGTKRNWLGDPWAYVPGDPYY